MRALAVGFFALMIGGVVAWGGDAQARKGRNEGKAMTAEEAITDAEGALDSGRVGDAIKTAERLQKTRGLSKEQAKRVDLIAARCQLFLGQFGNAEKLFAKLRKASPDDAKLSEWYARALDGVGKRDAALPIFSELAAKNALSEGDSYWALAQIEHAKGQNEVARKHAQAALEKPIVLQSDELEKEIHKFIDDLAPGKTASTGKNKEVQ